MRILPNNESFCILFDGNYRVRSSNFLHHTKTHRPGFNTSVDLFKASQDGEFSVKDNNVHLKFNLHKNINIDTNFSLRNKQIPILGEYGVYIMKELSLLLIPITNAVAKNGITFTASNNYWSEIDFILACEGIKAGKTRTNIIANLRIQAFDRASNCFTHGYGHIYIDNESHVVQEVIIDFKHKSKLTIKEYSASNTLMRATDSSNLMLRSLYIVRL